ncbi:MAG: DUF5916 domain-containing protein [Cyclobacteriaceae bacterium]
MKRLILLILLSPTFLYAQDDSYRIKKATGNIAIDGKIDEPDWELAQMTTNFHQYFPTDSVLADAQVEVRMTYDDQYLYISAKMHNLTPNQTYAVPSLRRDYRGNFDGFTIEIDPFQDNTNAFQFGINPYGVQREGLISNGGTRGSDLSLSWDNKWLANATQHENYWIAEAAIPFKTLRFKPGSTNWNVNFYRINGLTGERASWARIPRNFPILSLAFMKELIWDRPLKKSGPNVSLIPYVSPATTRDFESETQTSADSKLEFGGDAKIGVSPSLNLDLTVNPDFSQVELDQQVTNLNRFELFFPERRQFFLENADLFDSFGHPFFSRPFFSRRIGIARDESTGTNVQNKIYAGARLSGKLDKNWRIGLLNMQAAEDDDINLPSINYSVGALQRKIFGRSNIGIIAVNKQTFEDYAVNDSTPYQGKNSLLGFDYNIASSNGKWNGKINYHHSFDEQTSSKNGSHTGWIGYQSRTWTWSWAHVYVGENHNAQVGFVPRPGMFRINPDFGRNFFPKSGPFNSIQLQGEVEFFWNSGRKTDHKYAFNVNTSLANTGRLSASLEQNYTWLFSDSFDPTRTDGAELPVFSGYTYNSFNFNYSSDMRKIFSYSLNGYVGQFFNGDRTSLRTTLNYRFQPLVAFRLDVNYNRLRMPEPYNDADLWLIGPRVDLTLSKSIFFTNFIQYNSQIDNLNINSRFQWRFAPVSDLFVVYTDNYGTENYADSGLQKKNRALIIKMTYWFNL